MFLFYLLDGQIGEGVPDTEVEVKIEPSTVGDSDSIKRPESATSGELSSLNPDCNVANVDQSPARSPHARAWTVPGVYL